MNDLDPKPPSTSRLNPWDLLSILAVLMTFCVGGYFLMVFVNPTTPLNPFPPVPTLYQFPTATITAIQLQPTWTASPLPPVTATDTARPTFTAFPTSTLFSLIPPTQTPLATSTPKAPFSATVTYISSTIIHPDLGCNWLGVGGTVVDSSGADMFFQEIALAGTLNGQGIPSSTVTVSGVVPAYGRSGFEFNIGNILKLSTVPVASNGTLYLQVLDQAGLPLSNNVYFNTYNDCNKNLVLVRFKKNP